ncbi:hypothetical protein VTN49DRAFT_3186 [Thermomyces lanuginosus]|uniref:uncharacterized protein n=1 Tax=Thermomyces lanuginosus TaxID=5541 RepID=UPI003743AC04
MFSASLRQRPEWASLGPVLESPATPCLRESYLENYDFAYPIDGHQETNGQLCAILTLRASLEEAQQQCTRSRIERLAEATGHPSKDRAAILLLHHDGAFRSASGRCPVDSLVALQTLVFESSAASWIPIIPVLEPSALLPAIQEHCRSLRRGARRLESPPTTSSMALLNLVVSGGRLQPLSQHDVNVVSDLFPTFRDLSSAVRRGEGRRLLADYLGEPGARSIVEFWTKG